MKRMIALILLNCAAAAVLMGSCYDMFMPGVRDNLLDYLGMTRAEMSPRFTTLLLDIFRSLGGCLLAVAVTAFVLINGPVKQGERWASWTVLILVGLSEGINSTQMWRFGSPWYWPLIFVAMTLVGVLVLQEKSEMKS